MAADRMKAAEPRFDREGFDRLEGLVDHPSVHVRRWVSEGARPRRISIGDSVELSCRVHNPGARVLKLRMDYVLESPGARARPTRTTFRFADLELGPGETRTVVAQHAFVHRTIRTVRPGEHRITLKADGTDAGQLTVRVGEA